MPDFDEYEEFRALLRAARTNPDDTLPRLALADWLDERGATADAAFYRSEVSAALWRLEGAVRELPLPDLQRPGELPALAALCLLIDGLNKAATQIHEAAALHRARPRPDDPTPPAPKKRPRKTPKRKK
jgi:uncharacterized protein (TIGR02996 family)